MKHANNVCDICRQQEVGTSCSPCGLQLCTPCDSALHKDTVHPAQPKKVTRILQSSPAAPPRKSLRTHQTDFME